MLDPASLTYQHFDVNFPPGLVNFDTAVAYHLCINLPETFLQPGVHFLAKPAQQFTYTCLYELVEDTNLYAYHITSFFMVVLNTWH